MSGGIVSRTFAGTTYANGYMPPSIMGALDFKSGAFLRRDAAESLNRARADVLRQTGHALTVRGWYRTYAEQRSLFLGRYRTTYAVAPEGKVDRRWWDGRWWWRWRLASAAAPGTSNHGWGLAVDVVGYGAVGNFNASLRRETFPILQRHGWTDTEGRGAIQEPWHIVYDPSKDTRPVSRLGASTGTVTTPTVPGAPAPITPKDWLMALTSDEQNELKNKVNWIHEMLAYGGTVGGRKYEAGVLPLAAWIHQLLAYGGTIGDRTYSAGVLPIVAETQQRVTETPAKVWATPVKRASGNVSALQELADAKTAALRIQGENAGLRAALEALAKGQGLTADQIATAARQGAEEALKGGVKVTIDIPQEG
jgi:hypothetical protein